MRILLYIFFVTAVILAGYGFYIGQEDLATSQLFIGLGVTTLFFVWMPTFVYYRWKGKDVKQYMLNQENILKMRKYTNNNTL
jgi:hypothetical protein|tara:strand:+ start:496 stop:741 length:246 start_codon:yes stop_codon:yes gene_type:complete